MIPVIIFYGRWVILAALLLSATTPAFGCILQDFQVSTDPKLPGANEGFELVVDYQGSLGCISSEELTVTSSGLRVDIYCNCPFVLTDPVPQQFRGSVVGLMAGQYDVDVIDSAALPEPLTAASTHILIGHAPSIPISSLALTLLTLTLAAAAVWVLRR